MSSNLVQSSSISIVEQRKLPMRSGELTLLKHQSGAQIMHIRAPDKLSRFGIGFRTLPIDDSGASHALEHLVMKRDQKLRVESHHYDAANAYSSSAHLEHLNAQTVAGFTMFEAAGIYPRDLRYVTEYLSRVTTDPELRRDDFLREVASKQATRLNQRFWNGIVLNEMRAYGYTLSSQLDRLTYRLFYAGTPFQFDFGGSETGLKSLTLSKLSALHSAWYQSPNCRLFIYGDHQLERSIDQLLPVISGLPNNPSESGDSPTRLSSNYTGEINLVAKLSSLPSTIQVVRHSWILKDLTPLELLALQVIILPAITSRELFGSTKHSDTLRNSTIRTDLLLDVPDPIVSIDIIGDKGVSPDRLTELLLSGMNELECSGLGRTRAFERLSIEQLNWLDSLADSNFGSDTLEKAVLDWSAGRNPTSNLLERDTFRQLRDDVRNGQIILRGLISRSFLDRSKMLRISGTNVEGRDKERTQVVCIGRERQKLVDEYDFDSSFSVPHSEFTSVSEIVKNFNFPEVHRVYHESGQPILFHTANRNSRFSASTIVSTHRNIRPDSLYHTSLLAIGSELLAETDVVSGVMAEVDVEMTSVSNSDGTTSGDLSISCHIAGGSKRAVQRVINSMTDLQLKMGEPRARQLLKEMHLDLGESLRNSLTNLDAVETRAAALLSRCALIDDAINGFSLYENLSTLLRSSSGISSSRLLEEIQGTINPILHSKPDSILITSSRPPGPQLSADFLTFDKRSTHSLSTIPRQARSNAIELWITPGKVASFSVGIDLKSVKPQSAGALEVVQQILSTRYAWDIFRERLNCYDQDVVYDDETGILTISASCVADLPTSLYAAFAAGDKLANFGCSSDKLDGVIRSTLSNLDRSTDIETEHSEAWHHWRCGNTRESWLARRKQIAATKVEEVREIGIAIAEAMPYSSLVIAAPEFMFPPIFNGTEVVIKDTLMK